MSLYPVAAILESWTNLEIKLQLQVASSALLVYDYMLTFSSEVEFVWKKSFTPVTLVFAITRYLPFLDNSFGNLYDFALHLPFSVCVLSTRIWLFSFMIGVCTAQIVLILRTVAIWGGNKRIVIFLGSLLTGLVALALYYAIKYLQNFEQTTIETSNPLLAAYISESPACVISVSNDHTAPLYVAIMVFESVILLLTLSKAKAYRSESSRLSKAVFFDSITFFILLLILSILNVAIIPTPGDSNNYLTSLHRDIHSILTGRIILDIRRAAYETNESGAPTISTLMFGDNVIAPISEQSQD